MTASFDHVLIPQVTKIDVHGKILRNIQLWIKSLPHFIDNAVGIRT